MRTQLALAAGGAQGYLPMNTTTRFFRARHDHDLLRGDAVRRGVDELRRATATRCSRRCLSVLNNVSFWLTAAGVLLVNLSLFVGEFARTGWLAYPPLSEIAYSPGVGVDYYLWSLQIAGLGTLLSGVNLTTTILKMRAPGMRYSRMPVFCWTALASNLLIVAAFPILTATFAIAIAGPLLRLSLLHNDAAAIR